MRKDTGRSDEKNSRKIGGQPNKIASKMIFTQKLTHTNIHEVLTAILFFLVHVLNSEQNDFHSKVNTHNLSCSSTSKRIGELLECP